MAYPYGSRVTPARPQPLQGENSDQTGSQHPAHEEVISMAFSRGANLRDPPHQLEEGYAQRMVNYYYPRMAAFPAARPGAVEIALAGTGFKVTALHVYRKSEATSFYCFTAIDGETQGLWHLSGTFGDVMTPVLLLADLGSLATPCLVTDGNCLLVAVAGQPIREWQGLEGEAPGNGTTTVSFSGLPVADETITIGAEIWRWKVAGVPPFQVTIGGTAAACATNFAAAVNASSSIVKAAVDGTTATLVHVTARRLGAAGNLAMSEASTNVTVAGNLTGGADGLGIDEITTEAHPHPGFLVPYPHLGVLLAGGDPAAPDTVFLGTPRNHWQWASGLMGGGETFLLGNGDGTDVCALQPMLDQVVVHKAGQGREIYRLNLTDPDPATWSSSVKGFGAQTSALNFRCSASVADKHLFLDSRGFSVLTGTDTYDEIAVKAAGGVIANELRNASAASAFFVVNPDETYVLVVPALGHTAWCFDYAAGRWTRWTFATTGYVTCGAYSDAAGTVILGTSDGKILALDPDYATDQGASYETEILTRALRAPTMAQVLIKHTILDWRHLHAGAGTIDLALNNEVIPSQHLFDFELEQAELMLSGPEAAMLIEDCTMGMLSAGEYGRSVCLNHAGGADLVALRIKTSRGACACNGLKLRVAYPGKESHE